MPSTGTYLFHPELAELVDEAFEQAGVDPAKLTARHIRSAARSANLMMGTWFNDGYKQWTLGFVTESVIASQATFQLPIGGWDIFHAAIELSGGSRIELGAISRSDFNAIHLPTQEGLPDRYFVDKSGFLGADPRSTVSLYQVPDGAYDIHVWYIRRTEDIGSLSNTLDLPWHWQEAFAVGLASRLADKFPPPESMNPNVPPKATMLAQRAEDLFRRAKQNDRETSDIVISMSTRGSRRSRR